MAIWSDIDALGKLARILPYVFILLGFVVAASGQFFKSIVEARIGELESTALTAHKNTKPIVNAFLGHSARTGKKLLVMDAENDIPFKASWYIATENDVLVSPIMMSQVEIFPTKDNRRFSKEITINSEKVTNEYIELRFSYESVYSSEMNHPPQLHGAVTEKYRFVKGQILRWTDTVDGKKE